jgi:hypothetical protein
VRGIERGRGRCSHHTAGREVRHPVSEDYSAPMRAGRAFEEQVAQRYAGVEEEDE